MKILFLDVDGVLIPARNYFSNRYAYQFDPLAVEAVKRICKRTGAQVVMNTAWNATPPELRHLCLSAEFPLSNDWQTEYPVCERWEGITGWLAKHPDVTTWAVLDDDAKGLLPLPLNDFVRVIVVDPEVGITTANYREATRLLGDEDPFVIIAM